VVPAKLAALRTMHPIYNCSFGNAANHWCRSHPSHPSPPTCMPMRCSLLCRVTKERAAVASRPCTRLQAVQAGSSSAGR